MSSIIGLIHSSVLVSTPAIQYSPCSKLYANIIISLNYISMAITWFFLSTNSIDTYFQIVVLYMYK